MPNSRSINPRAQAENALKTAQQREEEIKQQIAREHESVEARTAKLRALRLAKEAADREAGIVAVARTGRTRNKRGRID